jgi:hypothetical protein
MDWRLHAMTLLVKVGIAALVVLTGASIVHNVTDALSGEFGTRAELVAHLR